MSRKFVHHIGRGCSADRVMQSARVGRSRPWRLSSAVLTAGDVYRALWRHKVFIAALTALFVAAALYATSRQARSYETSSLVRVQERGPTCR